MEQLLWVVSGSNFWCQLSISFYFFLLFQQSHLRGGFVETEASQNSSIKYIYYFTIIFLVLKVTCIV